MASGKLGMNVSEMESLKKLVGTELGGVRDVLKRLDADVVGVDWQGDDARRFKTSEWPDARRNLQRVEKILEETESKLSKNIAKQRQVSGQY